MKVSAKVWEYMEDTSRMNLLSTCSKDGRPNIAMFGSPLLSDESTLVLMLADNRSYANLKENPYAAYITIIPGTTGLKTRGCRLYVKVRSIEDHGATFDELKAKIRAKIGNAADVLKHLVVFDIVETRPIVDMGQGI